MAVPKSRRRLIAEGASDVPADDTAVRESKARRGGSKASRRKAREATDPPRKGGRPPSPLSLASVTGPDLTSAFGADLSEEEQILVRQAAQDQLCTEYLEEFVRRAWKIVEPGAPFDPNWHVDAIARELQVVYPGVRGDDPPFGWDVEVHRAPPEWPKEDRWVPQTVAHVDTREEAEGVLEYLASQDATEDDPDPRRCRIVPHGGVVAVPEPWRTYCPLGNRPKTLWRNSRLVINIPPGMMKSLLVSVFWPAFIWVHDPGHKTLSLSGGDKVSVRDAMKTRAIVGSKWYRRLVRRHFVNLSRTADEITDGIRTVPRKRAVRQGVMGSYAAVSARRDQDPWSISRSKDAKASYGTTLGGSRESTSIGGKITGQRGYGWTLDDPIDVKEILEHGQVDHARISERCLEVVRVIDKALDSRVNDLRDGLHYNVIIMQRLHVDDPPGVFYLRGARGEGTPWRFVVLRSRYVPDEDLGPEDPPNYEYDPRTEAGDLLFPLRFPEEVLQDKETRLGDQFNAQHQQNPLPGKGGTLSEALGRAQRYMADPFLVAAGSAGLVTPNGKPVGPLDLMITVDATFGATGATASNVAVQVWGRPFNPDVRAWMFLLDCTAARMNYTDTEDTIKNMKKKWPKSRRVLIEEKANGATLIHRLANSIQGIEPYDPKGSKNVRAAVLASCMKAGQVWIPHGDPRSNDMANPYTPWIGDFITELVRFPGGRRDDRVDAASSAVIYWTENAPAVDPREQEARRLAAVERVAGTVNIGGAKWSMGW